MLSKLAQHCEIYVYIKIHVCFVCDHTLTVSNHEASFCAFGINGKSLIRQFASFEPT
jgi:hypothetical protein